jgi:DNA helicase-2/ATP-dependent DNA helicase PcrA
MFTPRPKQQEVLDYQGGFMGVSAVPGSGKTWTLSRLAADIIASGVLEDDQEVLVVTLVNSAVDNFYQRVSTFVHEVGLLPHLGYRVRTLPGLAHDIVRERPDLLGLSENFSIIDEREAEAIRKDAVRAWLRSHPDALHDYLDTALEEDRVDWVLRDRLPRLVEEISLGFIRYAKDEGLTPARLNERLAQVPVPVTLVEMGAEIYADYQRALIYRGAVDFDDLIRLALEALKLDPDLLERLRYTWPYILEDEAQDSSRTQEAILKLLAGPRGNWVRVGDPNQAIYETFTTASPEYLRRFIVRSDVAKRELPNSGRSTPSIIELANHLVEWTMKEQPTLQVRDALVVPPYIIPTPPGDPQPNPEDIPDQIHLVGSKFTPREEIEVVTDSVGRWLYEHPEGTLAVLAPRNMRADELVDELNRRNVEVVDSLLRSTGSTRKSAGALGNMLSYLSDPGSSRKLATVYGVWRRADQEDEAAAARLKRNRDRLRKCRNVEEYVWPGPEGDWLEGLGLAEKEPEAYAQLLEFRRLVRRWQKTILLPVDQILLTLAQDLFEEPGELALTHKLAVLLRRASASNTGWRLPELVGELAVIARNERRFLGFSEDDTGFDPDKHKGKAVVATVHKAKGLEWDRVYLMSANNYDFPSGKAEDQYIAEKWFIRDKLNLGAETLEQLDAVLNTDEYEWYQEGFATQAARLDYVRERLRLLYVGITRAKRELIITWNTGRQGELQVAEAVLALMDYWSELHVGGGEEMGRDDFAG